MNASMGAITRNYTRRRVPPSNLETKTTRAGERETRVHPIFAEYTRSRGGWNGIYRQADTENGSEKRDGVRVPRIPRLN